VALVKPRGSLEGLTQIHISGLLLLEPEDIKSLGLGAICISGKAAGLS
jgi:hypothetical protein